jgi:parallel beta-helix repeat protein
VASDITGNTAKVSGSVTTIGTNAISDYGIVYGTGGSPTTSDSKMSLGSLSSPKDFTVDLSGLTQNTSYSFRTYVVNSGGTVYADAVTFKTLELKAPISTTGVASAITTTTFTMDGKLTDIGTANVTDFGHCLSATNQMPTIADTKTSIGASSTAKDFKSVFTGLKAGTVYYLRSYATNAVGTSYGDKVEVKTLSEAAPTVTTGAASVITSSTATMAGNMKSIGSAAITQHGHVWSATNASPTTADSKTTLGATTEGKDFSSSLTGLASGTTYNVRSYATNSVGTSYGDAVQFKTVAVTTITYDCNSTFPEVWEDLGDGIDYIVKCNVNIGGSFRGVKTLTIKPGVKIQFANGDAGFTIVNSSFLKMNGTAAKPIILEGTTATPGFWKGVDGTEANSLENTWEYVTIRHAGSSTTLPGGFPAGVSNYKSQFLIKNCTFSDNKGYGMVIGTGIESNSSYGEVRFFGFSNNTFNNNTKAGLRIHFTQWGYLDTESDYSKNGQGYVEVYGNFGGDKTFNAINDEMTVKKLNVPYRFLGYMTPSATVTFLPGVEVQFGTDAGFFIEDRNKTVAIIANGTAANPIKFVGYLPNIKGVWAGISAQNGNIETKFNYCIFDGAGSTTERFFCVPKESKAAIYLGLEYGCPPLNSRGTITNCTISNSGGYGIAYRDGDPATINNNTFKDNTKANVYLFK